MGPALDLLKIKSCFNSICWVKSLTNILSKPYSTYRVKSLTLLKNESVLLIYKNAFFAVQAFFFCSCSYWSVPQMTLYVKIIREILVILTSTCIACCRFLQILGLDFMRL